MYCYRNHMIYRWNRCYSRYHDDVWIGKRIIHSSAKEKRIGIRYGSKKPVMVFTAGAPGSGKTHCLNRIFGLENVDLTLDLDLVMPQHELYNKEHPHLVYEQKQAYDWANQQIEERFKDLLKDRRTTQPPGHDLPNLVCFDGTGTHVERQIRRMREAKEAGFWIVNLFVKVRDLRRVRRQRFLELDRSFRMKSRYLTRTSHASAGLVGDGSREKSIQKKNRAGRNP